jgi:tetratricopeptide (TPR) repeat protein
MRARESYDPASAEARRVDSPGEFDAAVKAYERALEVDPKLHAAQRGLGEIAWQRGDANGAEALLDRYLIDVPNAPDSLYVKKLLKRIRETPKESPP